MDYENFLNERDEYLKWNSMYDRDDGIFPVAKSMDFTPFIPKVDDKVNSPSHYTYGKSEAIDIIEDAITGAPSQKAGFNQGQALKYLLRLWHKSNSVEDAKKAEWYLKRLIKEIEEDGKWTL